MDGATLELLVGLAEDYNKELLIARDATKRKEELGERIKSTLRGTNEIDVVAGRFRVKILTTERHSLNADLVKQFLTVEQYSQAEERKVTVSLRVDPAR